MSSISSICLCFSRIQYSCIIYTGPPISTIAQGSFQKDQTSERYNLENISAVYHTTPYGGLEERIETENENFLRIIFVHFPVDTVN